MGDRLTLKVINPHITKVGKREFKNFIENFTLLWLVRVKLRRQRHGYHSLALSFGPEKTSARSLFFPRYFQATYTLQHYTALVLVFMFCRVSIFLSFLYRKFLDLRDSKQFIHLVQKGLKFSKLRRAFEIRNNLCIYDLTHLRQTCPNLFVEIASLFEPISEMCFKPYLRVYCGVSWVGEIDFYWLWHLKLMGVRDQKKKLHLSVKGVIKQIGSIINSSVNGVSKSTPHSGA